MKRTNAFVIDTNVPVVANHKHARASKRDVLECIRALEDARNGIVVIDDAFRILREYRSRLSPSGQPSAGDLFMKWLWDNQATLSRCERVKLTPCGSAPTDFNEFPKDARLDGFDPSDRKFAAVAKASRYDPPVLNASDSDWWIFEKPLRDNGIHVRHICPDLRKTWMNKPRKP